MAVEHYQTEQEAFWAGEFGNEYVDRNTLDVTFAGRTAYWTRVLRAAHSVRSIREFGCNSGPNLAVLKHLYPALELSAIEINAKALEQARALGVAEVSQGSIIEPMKETEAVDLTFTNGVLIHINPDMLPRVYENLYQVSRRYVLIGEYYNPTPVSVSYRGNEERLYKRDFAGEMIDRFGMKLVDYGFFYHRDNWAPMDDGTWFLLEK